MYLPRELMGRLCRLPDTYGRELVPMVTYTDLIQFVIMLCAIVTLVINIHKNSALALVK